MASIFVVDAIKAAYTADAPLVALTPGGLTFEVSTPGTATDRIVYHLPDDGVRYVRFYGGRAAYMTFLFTVYSGSLDKLRQILARMSNPLGPWEGKVYTLTAPEVSGGSRFLEDGQRMFKDTEKRQELTAFYGYVAEVYYETIVNNPQF